MLLAMPALCTAHTCASCPCLQLCGRMFRLDSILWFDKSYVFNPTLKSTWFDKMASSDGLRKRNVAPQPTKVVVTEEGKASDQRLDTHETYVVPFISRVQRV